MRKILVIIALTSLFSAALQADEVSVKSQKMIPAQRVDQFDIHQNIAYQETPDGPNLADIYIPTSTDRKHAAVIFVHGGPIPKEYPKAKDWPFFQSYGAMVTTAGLAGVVFNHRFNSLDDIQTATGDIRSVVDFVRVNADRFAVDKDRICLWIFSGGGSFVAPFLSDQPHWLECMVIYYGVLDPAYWESKGEEVSEHQLKGMDPFPLLKTKTDWDPAFFLAEAGEDDAVLNTGMRLFSRTAMENGWKVEYWNHPTGPHGFDQDKDEKRSREIIMRTIDFLSEQLNQESVP